MTEQPTKPSRATEGKITCVIESKTKGENSEVVGQPLEQPNTELLIVKTIQSLMTCVNDNLGKLNDITFNLSDMSNSLVLKAIEEINSFEKTTLFELQKAFE